MSFWKGFEKQAIALGTKGVQPLSSAGRMVGNRPSSMVSTKGAFKPAPLPAAKPISVSKASGVLGHTPSRIPKAMPKSTPSVVGEMAI